MRRHERRSLDEIEKRLSAEEPELARDLAAAELPTATRNRLLTGLTWVSVGVGVCCLFLGEYVSFLLMLLLVTSLLGVRAWRLRA
jgi:uncharacterized membrane protein YdbT with pleckstrin-like domain